MKNFFYGWAWGSAVKQRQKIVNKFQNLDKNTQQILLKNAQDKFGDKVGSTPEEFVQKMNSGDLDASAHQLNNTFYHATDDQGFPTDYEAVSDHPTKTAYEEGKEGLEKGVDLMENVSTTVINTKFPGFSDGYDKAKDTVDKVNKIYEGDFGGLATDAAKNALNDATGDFLKDKLGLDDDAASEAADLITDHIEEKVKSTIAANTPEDQKPSVIDGFDWGYISPAFPGGISVEDIIGIISVPDLSDLPGLISILTGDGSQEKFPAEPDNYDVTVTGENDASTVPDVTVEQDEGTVLPIQEGGGDGGGQTGTYTLSATASPADPGAGQGVTVTGRVTPPTAGLSISFSIVGTDGYSKSSTVTTSASGTATFYIPGGAEGVVDTVTVILVETGQTISFSYVF